jgi:hypothetical protein
VSIDNRLDQVDALIATDQRQQPPETVGAILKVIGSTVPGAGPLVSLLLAHSERQKRENTELVIQTMFEELKRVSPIVDELRQEPEKRQEEVVKLVLDATRKAEDLRDGARVKRIGKILAHAITLGPMSNFDKAEEMMRIARDLSDQDVLGLSQLYDSQFATLDGNGWKLDVHQINVLWKEKQPRLPGVVLPGEAASIFLKLQGLGLATAVERMDTQHGPNEQVFSLLPKGADFVRYIQGAVGTPSAVSAA